jgi:Cft2 family RNA processing exonuclease
MYNAHVKNIHMYYGFDALSLQLRLTKAFFSQDVLIVESTYGTHIHEKREDREHRFTSTIQARCQNSQLKLR